MNERAKEKELNYYAEGLSKTFIQRSDLYALQMNDGRYLCIKKPYSTALFGHHLKGDLTLGAYVLNENNAARYLVFDADSEEELKTLKEIKRSYPSYLENSRRGGHLWLFLTQPTDGHKVRKFGQDLLQKYGTDMELFPKQGESAGPGSLIRVPFGVHRKSMERYKFAGLGTWKEQMDALIEPETLSLDITESYQPEMGKPRKMEGKVWEKVKASISVFEFVRDFVDLKEKGPNAVGKCPFHSDDHPSFAVSKDDNYWNCFAGCGGGSIIDFWMTWRGVDFQKATKELADMLGVDDG